MAAAHLQGLDTCNKACLLRRKDRYKNQPKAALGSCRMLLAVPYCRGDVLRTEQMGAPSTTCQRMWPSPSVLMTTECQLCASH